jgi:hypothetical protein
MGLGLRGEMKTAIYLISELLITNWTMNIVTCLPQHILISKLLLMLVTRLDHDSLPETSVIDPLTISNK